MIQQLAIALCMLLLSTHINGSATTATAASAPVQIQRPKTPPLLPNALIQNSHYAIKKFDPRVQAFLKAKYEKQFGAAITKILQESPYLEQEMANHATIEQNNFEYLHLIDLALKHPNPVFGLRCLWETDPRQDELKTDYLKALKALLALWDLELSDTRLQQQFDQFIYDPACLSTPTFLDRETDIGKIVYNILDELGISHIRVAVIAKDAGTNAYAIDDKIIFIESALTTAAMVNNGHLAAAIAHEAQHISHSDTRLRDKHPFTRNQFIKITEQRADILGALQGPKFLNGLIRYFTTISFHTSCEAHPTRSQRLAALSKLYTELTTPYEQLIKQTITK
jgi:hypothetical protein